MNQHKVNTAPFCCKLLQPHPHSVLSSTDPATGSLYHSVREERSNRWEINQYLLWDTFALPERYEGPLLQTRPVPKLLHTPSAGDKLLIYTQVLLLSNTCTTGKCLTALTSQEKAIGHRCPHLPHQSLNTSQQSTTPNVDWAQRRALAEPNNK